MPQRSGFRSFFLPGGFPGGALNQSKGSIILKTSAIFAFVLKQLSSSCFHMFIYARSEQCDLVPIYNITNTQRIRIFQVNWNSSWSKFDRIQDKENQILFMFLTTENLSGFPCSHECKYGAYSDLSSYAVNLPG